MAEDEKELQVFQKIIKINEKASILISFRDITHLSLLETTKMLSSHKSILMATAAHELRNPLNGVIGML